jgi:hypothetical protein
MPHYADGTEAKIGDHVTGQLYNTVGKVAGTIVSITPGQDSCNAMVQYTRALYPDVVQSREVMAKMVTVEGKNLMAIEFDENQLPVARIRKTRNHQSDGPEMAFVVCADYGEIKGLTKIVP